MTAAATDTIGSAAELMQSKRVGSVVVVDGERPIGILTERDLVRFAASGTSPSETRVSEWMTADPDTVEPSETASEAFKSLAERGYRHIPVVSDGKLEGIVSLRDLMKLAAITPVEMQADEVPRGLEGVVVAETEIGDVRGMEGFYHYRQYNAVELAEKRSIEDVWYLLFHGSLPSSEQAEGFAAEIRSLRGVPDELLDLLPGIAQLGTDFVPLAALRTALSVMASALDFKPTLDVGADELRKQAMQICAVVPTLIMKLYRLSQGLDVIQPHESLPYAANYLYMLTGEEPSPEHARAVEQYLISTIDHGFNASTFTARVITSTGADLGAAVMGALGALSGPLHGGAPSRALDMLDAIGTPDNADDWIRDAVTKGERLMGFGHRVYKTDDPRSVMLRGIAEKIGGPQVSFAKHVEERAVAILEELKPGRQLYTNVEFYAGVVMQDAGLPRELFTPTFASSRVIGWCAHIMEQAADNRLIRPSARYVGAPPPQEVPEG
jgi:citrate synthase